MKNIKYIIFTMAIFTFLACKKSSLDLTNPNEPGIPALQTEEGMKRASLGVYSKFGLEYWWIALQNHDIMGDVYFTSVGNFSWRWANQVSSIKLSNATVLTPPQGGSQIQELRNRNSRAFGDDNAFYHEWLALYLVNNQANLILSSVEDPELKLSGDVENKKSIFRAWAYWWKGFAYSRIGSLYVAGIIANTLNETNDNFVTNSEMIVEANRQFDLAIAELEKVKDGEEYNSLFGVLIPSFTKTGNGGVISPAAWIRNINTYKGRNLLVGKEVGELTVAEWGQIQALAEKGIQNGDKIFTMRSALENDLVSETAWQPYRSRLSLWSEISERLVQEFKPGDNRFVRNIRLKPIPLVNAQGRGFQYSTRYSLIPIEEGGDFATTQAGLAEIPVACSFEENQLMLAEALIKTSKVEDGLKLIDAVRNYQKAGLSAVAGTGLNATAAYQELMRERRVALLNKNVAFYDARRWGRTKSVANGGGRTGAVLLYSANNQPTVDQNATIDYNYLSWWDVPENEIDFNTPREGSAPVKAK